MSSETYTRLCSQCGSEIEAFYENRPHEFVNGECLECGFFYYTVEDRLSLRDVNWRRKQSGLKSLKRLKE